MVDAIDPSKRLRLRFAEYSPLAQDLGETSGNPEPHPEMPDPSCKGGIVRWEEKGAAGGARAIFALNVDSTSLRVNPTVYATDDDGATFNRSLKVDTSGGYATINTNNANQIAAFYDYTPGEHPVCL